LQVSVKSNIKQFSKQLRGFEDQIPFAASKALNKTAFEARGDTQEQLKKDIDRPTPFTLRGVRYRNSTKRRLIASVYFTPDRWRYLRYQVEGGRRRPQRFAIAVPAGVRRNKYGNPARGSINRLLARPDTFSATIKGTPGIWQRTRSGGLKLLYHYQSSVTYTGGRFQFNRAVNRTVKRRFNHHFTIAMKQAIRTARLS